MSFADLKKYKFYYWFGFPVLHSDPSWVPADPDNSQHQPIPANDSAALVDAVQNWMSTTDNRQHGFFLARKQKRVSRPEIAGTWQVSCLSEYENGFFTGAALKDRYICFADPSNYDDAPGWMLRNLLVLIKERWKMETVQILRYRDTPARRDEARSTVIRLTCTTSPSLGPRSPTSPGSPTSPRSPFSPSSLSKSKPMPRITGWERNATGKLAGRIVDLTDQMDPKRFSFLIPSLN